MNENVSEEGFVISKFLFKKVLDNLSEFSDYINDQESFKLGKKTSTRTMIVLKIY